MANSANNFPLSYYIKDGDRFILNKADKQLVFNRIPSTFYCRDVRNRGILVVFTITGNQKGYTAREFVASTEAREGLAMMGNPSPMDYIIMVCSGILHN